MWWLAGSGRRCWRSQRRWPTACWELVCLLLPAESLRCCSCLPCDTGVWQAGPSGARQVGGCLSRTHATACFISTGCKALDEPVRQQHPADGCDHVCSTVLGPGRQGQQVLKEIGKASCCLLQMVHL